MKTSFLFPISSGEIHQKKLFFKQWKHKQDVAGVYMVFRAQQVNRDEKKKRFM